MDSAIQQICGVQNVGSSVSFVNVSTLEVPYQRTFGPFAGALPDFHKINDAAYWDYQREKVFVRTIKHLRQTLSGAKRVGIRSTARQGHESSRRHPYFLRSLRIDQNLESRMSNTNDRRYHFFPERRPQTNHKVCDPTISLRSLPPRNGSPRQKTIFGTNLRAYIVYLLIEMRLSHNNIAEHLRSVFGLTINPATINDIKAFVAREYEPLYRTLLLSISRGTVVHADETKGVVYGGGHYIWIFANCTTVGYVYSPSREGDVLRDVLQGFSGVLISDFFAAYESIECAQQKCLIHLMRDINELVLKNPFNSELGSIANDFGVLLRSVVDTIDKWGLKTCHLRRHKRDVDKFFSKLESSKALVGSCTFLK